MPGDPGRDAPAGPPIRIELLGVPRILVPGKRPRILTQNDAALLAFVALNGPTPLDAVVGLLWPALPKKMGQGNLRQRRKRLREDAGREVVAIAPWVALADGVEHDLGRGPLQEGDLALSTPGVRLLGQLDYADCPGLVEWVEGARERWHLDRCRALDERASQLERDGAFDEALAYAERLGIEAPTAEHTYLRMMRLHYLLGRRSAALAAFERCETMLAAEFGAPPGPAVLALARTIERSEVLQAAPAPSKPVNFLRPPRLIARSDEWAAMAAAWSLQRPILIRGEAGIGKSRLARDFSLAHGASIIHRGEADDVLTPYSSLIRILRDLMRRLEAAPPASAIGELARLLPELGSPAAGRLDAVALRRAFGVALEHWHGRGLVALVIDDLQFVDAASLELLLASLSSSVGQPALLTVRSGEIPAALARWLREPSVAFCEIALEPLDRHSLAELLDSLAIEGLDAALWIDPLLSLTGGNTMFVLETLLASCPGGALTALTDNGALRLATPDHVVKLLERRLAVLPAEALRLARVAALSGSDFSDELAAQVLQTRLLDLADAWAMLESAHVFRQGMFAHDLIREAARRSVPDTIARSLHGAIADVLEHAHTAPGRVAHHWHAARAWARAAPQFERAALAAQAASRPLEALAAWDAAAACHRAAALPGSAAAAHECDWHAVTKLSAVGQPDNAIVRVDAMLASAIGDRQRAVALAARAQVQVERSAHAPALADALQAIALATASGDERLSLLATHHAASALMRLGRADESIALRHGEVDRLHLLDDEERLQWADMYAAALDYADRRSEAVAAFDDATLQAERLRRWDSANALCCSKAIALTYLNRIDDSVAAGRQAIEHGERAGLEPAHLLMERMTLAANLRDLGHFSDFLASAEPMPQALREVGYPEWASNAENDLAGAYLWLGRHDLAVKALGPLPADVPAVLQAARLFLRARLQREDPRSPGGEKPALLVNQAKALIESSGGTARSYVRLKVALEVARDLAPREGASLARDIELEALDREQFMLAVHALTLRVQCLLRTADKTEAAHAALRLANLCKPGDSPGGIYAPEVWWSAHRALVGTDRAAAAACLRAAVAWIERSARHVPVLFRESFCGTPINREVLAAARMRR